MHQSAFASPPKHLRYSRTSQTHGPYYLAARLAIQAAPHEFVGIRIDDTLVCGLARAIQIETERERRGKTIG